MKKTRYYRYLVEYTYTLYGKTRSGDYIYYSPNQKLVIYDIDSIKRHICKKVIKNPTDKLYVSITLNNIICLSFIKKPKLNNHEIKYTYDDCFYKNMWDDLKRELNRIIKSTSLDTDSKVYKEYEKIINIMNLIEHGDLIK